MPANPIKHTEIPLSCSLEMIQTHFLQEGLIRSPFYWMLDFFDDTLNWYQSYCLQKIWKRLWNHWKPLASINASLLEILRTLADGLCQQSLVVH